MEEEIEIVEELLQGSKDAGMYEDNKYFYSLENLIKEFKKIKIENIKYQVGQMPDTTEEYKNLKKELEKWKNGEM